MAEKKKVTKTKKTVTKKPAVKKDSKKKETYISKPTIKVPVEIKPARLFEDGKINHTGLLVQAVLTTYAVLLLIGGLFAEFFLNIFDAVVAILFFVIAYNNDKIFKRKNLTIVYIIAGLVFAGMFIARIFN